MHLLLLRPGGLPRRRHRLGTELRVRDRDTRGALLRQGTPARERRPLGAGDREEHLARRALPVTLLKPLPVGKRSARHCQVGQVKAILRVELRHRRVAFDHHIAEIDPNPAKPTTCTFAQLDVCFRGLARANKVGKTMTGGAVSEKPSLSASFLPSGVAPMMT